LRIALISDIHGNLEALETAFDDIQRKGVDEIWCLGDIVGYGANPSECLELVSGTCSAMILGNHDEAAFQIGVENGFNDFASHAILWTRSNLSSEQLGLLKSLPYKISRSDILLVHASPSRPQAWKYVFGSMDAMSQKTVFSERLCFIGHSHIPGIYPLTGSSAIYNSTDRFIINVGSIGQPRDGDPRLSYGLLDTFSGSYENIRLEYDTSAAANKIRDAGLPAYLADRLLHGR
jgi:diadenosine tetraphosphatase ApaH/serine/threonine PP2A family protein phosphatase